MAKGSKRVVIATIGSLGDLHPYMAVALGLKARGHEVVFAAPRFYRERVAAASLAFEPVRPDPPLPSRELYARMLDPKAGTELTFRNLLMPAVGETYDDLERIILETKADLLVSNLAVLAAPLIAEKLNLLWASTVLAPMTFFSAYEPPVVSGVPAAITSGPRNLRP
jgi:rhamnosyltransferase subunit B